MFKLDYKKYFVSGLRKFENRIVQEKLFPIMLKKLINMANRETRNQKLKTHNPKPETKSHSWHKIFIMILFWGMVGGNISPVLAASSAHGKPPKARENMQDIESVVKAKSALLCDATTGQILFSREADDTHPPASTLKLMTALLVYEHTRLNGSVTITPEDAHVEASHVPLIPGETVSINILVHALLIGSDNDSAMALARHTGGTVPHFVEMMNSRAARLGCTQTEFKNPHGLPIPGQYTTCLDLLKIFRAAMSVPALHEICETKEFVLKTERGTQLLRNHNKLLGKYPGMGPAKTGWTIASRHTYAASATRDGHELQLIILDSPNKWIDAVALFNYGFTCVLAPPPMLTPPTVTETSANANPSKS